MWIGIKQYKFKKIYMYNLIILWIQSMRLIHIDIEISFWDIPLVYVHMGLVMRIYSNQNCKQNYKDC